MATISDLLRLIAKPIFLKLGKGLKSSKTKYCLGEEINIRLDDSIIGKDNVIAKPPTRTNSFARWKDSVGKELTDSKTIQDENGNTSTRTSADTLSYITSNESEDENSVAVHAVESKGGRPINRLFIPGKQLVDSYISNTDYSYNIFLNDIENSGLAADCLKINRDGNVDIPFQYSVYATFDGDSVQKPSNQAYSIGTDKKMIVLENIGNNFFPGDGSGNPAYYQWNSSYKIIVYMVFIIQKVEPNPAQMEIQCRLKQTGSRTKTIQSLSIIPGTFGKNTVQLFTGIKGVSGDRIYFDVFGAGSTWYIYNPFLPNDVNYIGIYRLP